MTRVPAVAAAACAALVACGGGGRPSAVVTGPSMSAIPGTTAPPTATPSPSSTPTVTPLATPTPPSTPTPGPTPYYISPQDPDGARKVGDRLYPSTGVACGAQGGGHYDLCPVTSRLAARLDSHPTDGAEPLCRCQNAWQSSSITTTGTPDPNVVVVHVVLSFGPGVSEAVDVRVLRTESGWVADDTTCTGRGESTSIYSSNPPPCPA